MMKLLVVALVLGVAAAQQCDCKGGSTTDKLRKALDEKAGLMAKWGADCKKESAETDDWLKQIGENSAANKADRLAREADKGKLAEALETRVKGLKVFIGQLQAMLDKLGYHIERTNKLFSTKYDANLNDQTAASLALHDLSLDFAAPHNVKLNPIQQVKDWSPAGGKGAEESPTPAQEDKAAEGKDAVDAKAEAAVASQEAEAKMMFLETQVRQQMHICQGPGCQVAYQKSFALYKLGYRNNVANKKNFELERDSIGMFRKKTREMLEKKKAKLGALQKQLTDLKAAMASPDGNLSELFPLIKQHAEVFDASCAGFATASASGKEALTALLTAIEAKAKEAAAEDAKEAPDGATGAAAADLPTAEPEKPVEGPKAAEPVAPAPKVPAAPAPKEAKKAEAKPADEDLTKILNAPAPESKF